jgi:hypothetical protein
MGDSDRAYAVLACLILAWFGFDVGVWYMGFCGLWLAATMAYLTRL